jgi:ABC-type lipoprotein release transport system permease subunit
MIALIIVGHPLDGVSLIAGALVGSIGVVLSVVLGTAVTLAITERRDRFEGIEDGTYGEFHPYHGRWE